LSSQNKFLSLVRASREHVMAKPRLTKLVLVDQSEAQARWRSEDNSILGGFKSWSQKASEDN
jgi:hypothetical protein